MLTSFQQGWLDRGKELNAIYDALTSAFGRTETHNAAADIALLGEERDRYRDALEDILDHAEFWDDDDLRARREIAGKARAALSRTQRTEDS